MTLVAGTFAAWIDGHSPVAIGLGAALCVLGAELVVLGHELGHAAIGILRTEGLIVVRVGRTPALWTPRVGRLQLRLNPIPAWREPDGQARIHAHLGRGSRVVLSLAGPAAGCFVAALLFLYGLRYHLQPLTFAGGGGFLFNLANLLPFQRRGCRSDGARLLDALRAGRTRSSSDPSADARSRWLVLFTDLRSVLAPADLLRLGGAPIAVGYAPEDRSDAAVALWRLASAGWCWREAERADLSAIRDRVLDERQAAAGREATRDAIVASAARELAAGDPHDPSLEVAFFRLRAYFGALPLRDADERFAFRFGAALHDIERLAS